MHPEIGDERDSQNDGFPEQVPCIDGRYHLTRIGILRRIRRRCYRGLAKSQERGNLIKSVALFM